MLTWNNCFSDERFGIENSEKGIRSQYEVDWDRLVFSSPFRRLQNKTQVFPLPDEVFVHNRLTHSLEVASVGRSLGAIVGKSLSNEIDDVRSDTTADSFYQNDLKHVIAAACLAHDMGNPAFGHSGEEAISKYFSEKSSDKLDGLELESHFTIEQWNDLINFEGNANALRVLTKQQYGRLFGGFRLTYSTLGSILKYPCESQARQGKKGPIHLKKYGFFDADRDVFQKITSTLNMIQDTSLNKLAYHRHPFVFLVEAADDICYNIIDYEDAHRLKILSFDEVKEPLMEIISLYEKDKIAKTRSNLDALRNDNNEAIAYLRAKSINCLTQLCAEAFLNKQDKIIQGQQNVSLMDELSDYSGILKNISDISIKRIYNHESVIRIELAGFRIMSGLVEDFVEAALTKEEKRLSRHKKVLKLLPIQCTIDETSSSYEKVMNIIDFVSGMTDLFALKLYRNLRGIEMPHI